MKEQPVPEQFYTIQKPLKLLIRNKLSLNKFFHSLVGWNKMQAMFIKKLN